MRHATRGLAGVLAAILSLALVPPVAATEPPSTEGLAVCNFAFSRFNLATGTYDAATEPVQLEPYQGFVANASGLPPNTTVTFRFHLSTHRSQPVDRTFEHGVATDAGGNAGAFFMFRPDVRPWNYTNTWELTVSSPPGCTDIALLQVAHTAGPFTDTQNHQFEAEIRWAHWNGVTKGCTASAFCPDAPVTRDQMASFMTRAFGFHGADGDHFTDDETSVHEDDINRMAAASVTHGCTLTTFCPRQPVTREQMASFLVRALQLPGTSTDFFTDDEASPHEADINALAASGITAGCTATTYCPTATVTRAQMTAFLHRAVCCGLHIPIPQA